MSRKYRWYERLFFKLQLREKGCWKLLIILFCLLFLGQLLLTCSAIRKLLVLTETFEGKPLKFYKSFNSKDM